MSKNRENRRPDPIPVDPGLALATAAGDSAIEADWTAPHWSEGPFGECQAGEVAVVAYADLIVRPPVVTFSTIGSIEFGGTKSVTVTITGGKNKTFTIYLLQLPNSVGGITFDDGTYTKSLTPNTSSSYSTTYTIKGSSYSLQLNDSAIRATYNGGTQLAEQKFTVSSIAFKEDNACSGFDSSVQNQPYVAVHKGGANTAKAVILPSGASGTFNFYPQNGITVSPSTMNTSSQVLTITGGNTAGEYSLDVKVSQTAPTVATLKAAVLARLDKTVVIHTIVDSYNGTSPATANIPTASALQTYLNDTTWGVQANIYFTVTNDSTPHSVNFDINHDSKFDDSNQNEWGPIRTNVRDSSYDVNLFYEPYTIIDYATSGTEAFTYAPDSWFSDKHHDSVNNLAAHEIGHAIGRTGHNSSPAALMTQYSGNTSFPNPCNIGKSDWTLVNP